MKKPPCTCCPIYNGLTNEKRQKTDGTLVVTWCKSFVREEATLLEPTSFEDELFSQVENSSIEVVRELSSPYNKS